MASCLKTKTKAMAVGSVGKILLVGCGGTGAFLAEHLCRMIAGVKLDCSLVLADGDVVEQGNIWRQNFEPHEIGQNKAEALGLRLSGRFGLPIEIVGGYIQRSSMPDTAFGTDLVITATDTLASRKIVADAEQCLWLDVGNEKTHGQAVLGTTHDAAKLRRCFWNWIKDTGGYVADLPDIAALNPAILTARKVRKRTGCGQMPFTDQGFGVNAMAALAAAQLAKQAVVDAVVTRP
ncbi:MAG: hypothetical protein DRP56_01050, partial [Planctomycetota bacterium]